MGALSFRNSTYFSAGKDVVEKIAFEAKICFEKRSKAINVVGV